LQLKAERLFFLDGRLVITGDLLEIRNQETAQELLKSKLASKTENANQKKGVNGDG
jgi:hypothetical protein